MILRSLFYFLVAWCSAGLAAEPGDLGAAEPGAEVRLISEVGQIRAGEPFSVGIGIRHRAGFHSYWKNPGSVGFATTVEWQLPPGFEAGEIIWPRPERVDMAGHPAHGFTRDVLLMVRITPPREIKAGEVQLAARVLWMACADGCRPGDESVSLALPVGPRSRPDPGFAGIFRRARAELPKPLGQWSGELLSGPESPVIRLRLRPAAGTTAWPEAPYFFSEDGQVASGVPDRVETGDGGLVLSFPRAEFGPRGVRGLPGLLAFGPGSDREIRRIDPAVGSE